MRFLIALFLVIVAMNVAVLVYARTVMRTGEIAVRTALGATRGRIVAQLFAEALVLSGLSALVGLGIVAVGLRMVDRSLADFYEGHVPFWLHSGLSAGTVLYALTLAVLAAVIVGVFPALRATGAQLRTAMGSLGSGAKARLGRTWTVLIVSQVAITVAILPLALHKGAEMTQLALRKSGFAAGEYLSTQFIVERDADPSATAGQNGAAADSAREIVSTLIARLATEPAVVGATITSSPPWEGAGAFMNVDGPIVPEQRVTVMNVDTSFFRLFGVRVLGGRIFAAGDVGLPWRDRPVIVNRSFAREILGGGDPVGRRIRYQRLRERRAAVAHHCRCRRGLRWRERRRHQQARRGRVPARHAGRVERCSPAHDTAARANTGVVHTRRCAVSLRPSTRCYRSLRRPRWMSCTATTRRAARSWRSSWR